jgi:hypothetical protein
VALAEVLLAGADTFFWVTDEGIGRIPVDNDLGGPIVGSCLTDSAEE